MFAIRCTLLRDSFEGGAWDDPERAEWPPSPMRLFSALVAVADHAGGADDALLHALEQLPAPEIHCARGVVEGYRRAFVPTNSVVQRGGSTTLPGRTNGERGWARVIPASPVIWYRWTDAELEPAHRERLSSLCQRVPYLGRSTSPALIELVDGEPPPLDRLVPEHAVERGHFDYRSTIRAPYAGALRDLRDAHQAKYEHGEPGDPWEIGRSVEYGVERPVEHDRIVEGPYEAMVVLALRSRRLDGRHTARVTSAVRRALLARAPGLVAALHGHHDGDVVQCAILGLPFVGATHADGHLLGISVTMPRALAVAERRVVAAALPPTGGSLTVLAGPLGRLEFERLTPLDAGAQRRRALGLAPARWSGPARAWASALPMVLDRYLKRHDDVEAHVRRAVVHSGFPEPVAVDVSLRPLIAGAVDLRPTDTLRRRGERGFKPYRHVRLRFAERVRGPVVLGSMRHYGLGLCVPLTEDVDA